VKALLALVAALAACMCWLGAVAVLLGASQAKGACSGQGLSDATPSGSWTATAYGPPWGGIEGSGITATGVDLRSGPPALEVAADPKLLPLGSYVHVWPNPFGTRRAFYVGDTGAAIVGRRIDIYDWRGRAAQLAWGIRSVSVTAASGPEDEGGSSGCPAPLAGAQLQVVPGKTARVLPDGSAAAPADAPAAVTAAIAAGNLIHTLPYPSPDAHFGTLARLWPAYDCSGAVSFVLYGAGLLGPDALDSTGLESYGLPGLGRWITIYANAAHSWIVVAGIALDTAEYGGPAIPAGSGPRWRSEALANLGDGARYVVRHPSSPGTR
jgi:3D (Asp-Asp-Asp) domain-containing protein